MTFWDENVLLRQFAGSKICILSNRLNLKISEVVNSVAFGKVLFIPFSCYTAYCI